MEKITVYSPQNEITKDQRSYNTFFDELTDKLKERFIVEEQKYHKDAHLGRCNFKLKKLQNDSIEMIECEYIIEKENGDFYVLSMSEQISAALLSEQSNPHFKKALYSQYIPDQMVHHCKENSHKYEPWIFFPMRNLDYDTIYQNRLKKDKFIKRMFFKGGIDYRPIINHITKDLLSEPGIVPPERYFDNMTNYEMCLSIGGTANGDLCYRDVECMAIGVPMIRFDFTAILNPALIPNYHYISIPLQLDLPKHNDVLKDRLGGERHGKLIEQRFNEVKDNRHLLEFVSNNARKYYEKYLSRESRINYTLQLLNL